MNCIVVDDEPLARKGMQMLIEQLPLLNLKGMFSNAVDADIYLKNNRIDIIFIDIQMPLINGMDFIKTSKHPSHVIITSAYPHFALDAFELNVRDYLVKPIRFDRFYKAVNKLLIDNTKTGSHTDGDEDYLFIRAERKYVRTNYNEIDSIEGLKDYIIIYCGEEKHIVATNLKSIYEELPAHLFLRVNKSCIVNMSKVKSVDSKNVIINSKIIPIGENFKKTVFDFINHKTVIKRA